MEYTIQSLASLAGITTRTLRYYDSIKLLAPAYVNESGYRIYQEAQVDALQQILFYREMGLELAQIKQIVSEPSFNRLAALKNHLENLHTRQIQLRLLIENVNKSIKKEEGIIAMTDKEKFEGFKQQKVKENEESYGTEIREKYGDETVEKSNAKMIGLSKEEYDAMQKTGDTILSLLEDAVHKNEDPSGVAGQKIAKLHKKWLGYTWSTYSKDAHNGLVHMYTEDERFTAYYDGRVKGCAGFLKEAVLVMNLD